MRAEEFFPPRGRTSSLYEHFYFHNCTYEGVWEGQCRRRIETRSRPTLVVIRTYGEDYGLVFVGDAR